jgi:hypothetical protein
VLAITHIRHSIQLWKTFWMSSNVTSFHLSVIAAKICSSLWKTRSFIFCFKIPITKSHTGWDLVNKVGQKLAQCVSSQVFQWSLRRYDTLNCPSELKNSASPCASQFVSFRCIDWEAWSQWNNLDWTWCLLGGPKTMSGLPGRFSSRHDKSPLLNFRSHRFTVALDKAELWKVL